MDGGDGLQIKLTPRICSIWSSALSTWCGPPALEVGHGVSTPHPNKVASY
jgi:hypothetical protein